MKTSYNKPLYKFNTIKYLLIIFFLELSFSQKIIIPMDQLQPDHLKAYGIAFWSLKNNNDVDWLLNFRGGTFMIDRSTTLEIELKVRGVYYEIINTSTLTEIFATIEENNMDMVLLEKLPKIAVLALNPHSHSNSKFSEEKKIIFPAINESRKLKINVIGPISPDTSFMNYKKNKILIIICHLN